MTLNYLVASRARQLKTDVKAGGAHYSTKTILRQIYIACDRVGIPRLSAQDALTLYKSF